jgi:putative lipoprotein
MSGPCCLPAQLAGDATLRHAGLQRTGALTMTRPLLLRLSLAAALATTAACQSLSLVTEAPLLGVVWTLTELDGQPAGGGEGRQPATLTLEIDTPRASGFAGCNRFTGNYALQPPSLQFSGMASTRMACPEGEALERRYLAALAATRDYRLEGKVLQLRDEQRVLARFQRY